MKKCFICLLFVTMLLPLCQAQDRKSCNEKNRPNITELVDDLTPAQKKKLEKIAATNKAKIDVLKDEQAKVRDSIQAYMNLKTDNTEAVNRLIDREMQLKAEIRKLKYSNKVQIDKILTDEQFQALQKKFSKEREKCKKH